MTVCQLEMVLPRDKQQFFRYLSPSSVAIRRLLLRKKARDQNAATIGELNSTVAFGIVTFRINRTFCSVNQRQMRLAEYAFGILHDLAKSTLNARMAFSQINAKCAFGIWREGTPILDYKRVAIRRSLLQKMCIFNFKVHYILKFTVAHLKMGRFLQCCPAYPNPFCHPLNHLT